MWFQEMCAINSKDNLKCLRAAFFTCLNRLPHALKKLIFTKNIMTFTIYVVSSRLGQRNLQSRQNLLLQHFRRRKNAPNSPSAMLLDRHSREHYDDDFRQIRDTLALRSRHSGSTRGNGQQSATHRWRWKRAATTRRVNTPKIKR